MSRNGPTYSPYGAYELKRSYQRNLLLANLSVLGLVALMLAIAWVTGGLNSQEIMTITRRDVDRSVHVITAMMEPPKPVRRNVTASKPEAPKDLWIMDKIRIVTNAPEPIPFDSTPVYSDTSTERHDSTQSYSDLIGDRGIGVYPPANVPSNSITEPDIVPCSVLVAVKPEYPWVARDRKKEGVAGLIVCIGVSGKVTLFSAEVIQEFQSNHLTVEKMTVEVDGRKCTFNYVVTIEEPKGWFFAKKVAEVLPKWVFAPSKIDGEVVASLIPIGHAFCLTEECTYEHAVLNNYKHFPSQAMR